MCGNARSIKHHELFCKIEAKQVLQKLLCEIFCV